MTLMGQGLGCPTSGLGAGSQQVDHIQVMPDVDQDLQLGHQRLALIGRCALCLRETGQSLLDATGRGQHGREKSCLRSQRKP